MTPILLIHGSGHGAWCWRDVLPILNNGGHAARAIDLPSHGNDKTPPDQTTLDLYAKTILDAITEPTILVGHSMAGFPISLAAEQAPEKIARLIYVCAYVPLSGLSLADMRRLGPSQPLREAIMTSDDGGVFRFRPEMVEAKFYHDCPPGTVEYAKAHLTPEPITPQATPINLGAGFRAVTKRYIQCSDDRAIPPAYQATMAKDLADFHTLSCGHSPFFAQPKALCDLLIR